MSAECFQGKRLCVCKDRRENEHVQKRLLLANLKELYQLFQEENPDLKKIGLSTFCSLRPEECITEQQWKSQCLCLCTTSKCQINGFCY